MQSDDDDDEHVPSVPTSLTQVFFCFSYDPYWNLRSSFRTPGFQQRAESEWLATHFQIACQPLTFEVCATTKKEAAFGFFAQPVLVQGSPGHPQIAHSLPQGRGYLILSK